MTPAVIAFIVVYCVVLCCYFYTETTGNLKLRAPNKILLALMFFVFGTVFILKNFIPNEGTFHYLAIVGLFLAMLGDFFLLISYNRGGDFFLAGNVCLIAYQVLLITTYGDVHINRFWWALLVIVALWGLFCFLFTKFPNFFKLGKMKWPFLFYLSSIIPNGVFGIATMIYVPKFFLFGLGMFIFMLSDFDITFHKFVYPDNKWVLRLNSALYFTGMLIAVLNFALI